MNEPHQTQTQCGCRKKGGHCGWGFRKNQRKYIRISCPHQWGWKELWGMVRLLRCSQWCHEKWNQFKLKTSYIPYTFPQHPISCRREWKSGSRSFWEAHRVPPMTPKITTIFKILSDLTTSCGSWWAHSDSLAFYNHVFNVGEKWLTCEADKFSKMFSVAHK